MIQRGRRAEAENTGAGLGAGQELDEVCERRFVPSC